MVVKRDYRPFPIVAFNRFSSPANSISKNVAILIANRSLFTLQKPILWIRGIFEMSILWF
jgi:hypothetical protein